MIPKITKKDGKSNEDALAALVSKKAEIDTMLTWLQTLGDDHFRAVLANGEHAA